MASSVIARQSGDDYQAYFFWLKAAELNHSASKIQKVAWELNSTFGFDDVVVYYHTAKLDSGIEISEEYFQIKFHVSHTKSFTCEALTDPEFIGAKKESILQRLLNLYNKDKDRFKKSRYYLINTWGLDRSDLIGSLLDNNGKIRRPTLFNCTDESKYGKIRKLWREHLGVTDDVLFEMLPSLVIKHSFDDEQRLKENLNNSLSRAGLRAIPVDERSSKYVNLIQQLHKEGKNLFTWQEIYEACKREDLLQEKISTSDALASIGVRSFQKGAENLHLEVDSVLCLQRFFGGRFILDEFSWDSDIKPLIEEFAEKAIALKKPLIIFLDTHLSSALYLGYCLDPKYGGLDITIVQKTATGKLMWKPLPENLPGSTGPNWNFQEKELSDTGTNLVLSLSITKDLKADVEDHLSSILDVGKVIHASIRPGPSSFAIKDANHIVLAIQELLAHVKSVKRGNLKSGNVHLFLSAPNAFAFFLGQVIKPLGQIVLYEFDFENTRGGNYESVITINNHLKTK